MGDRRQQRARGAVEPVLLHGRAGRGACEGLHGRRRHRHERLRADVEPPENRGSTPVGLPSRIEPGTHVHPDALDRFDDLVVIVEAVQ